MTRLFLTLAVLSVALVATNAHAQSRHSSHGSHWGHLPAHDYWHHNVHVPDVAQLDRDANTLASIARHLHEDAHELSQDYHHSEAIEHYVDKIDRLQHHMHELLHDAVVSGRQSSGLISHIKSDVRQVKSLLSQLYGELSHQGFDGARPNDFQLMAHMRQIIVQQAYPLAKKMEAELCGFNSHSIHSTHRYPIQRSRVIRYRF